jgi:hypothetical protein
MSRRVKHHATWLARNLLLSIPDIAEKEQLRSELISRLARWPEKVLREWREMLERLWEECDLDEVHAWLYHRFRLTIFQFLSIESE